MTDGTGNVVEEYRYDPLGKTYRKTAEGAWEVLKPGQRAATDRLYTGRERDAETGLYHYRARTYSPELGRFLQRDPIGTADQINRYAYVGNNPMVATDPSGMVIKQMVRGGVEGDFVENPAVWNDVGNAAMTEGNGPSLKDIAHKTPSESVRRGFSIFFLHLHPPVRNGHDAVQN